MSDPKSSGPSIWGVGARWLMLAGAALVLTTVASAIGLRLVESVPTVPSPTISPSPVPSGPTFVDPVTIFDTGVVVPTDELVVVPTDLIVVPTDDLIVVPTNLIELPTDRILLPPDLVGDVPPGTASPTGAP